MSNRVMILAGGTGGHIYPALAVSEVLRGRGLTLGWLGATGGMEQRLVRDRGIEFFDIVVSGLRGRGLTRWLRAPQMLWSATLQAMAALRRFRPDVVLGMGGFVSGPGGLAARLLGLPLVIHEQNAIPGLTNRLLSRVARRVLEAYAGSFPAARHALCTGNPVRAEIAALVDQPREPAADGVLRVLVMGGSRGARRLNELVPAALGQFPPSVLSVWHQTGEADLAQTRARYAASGLPARVMAFIPEVIEAYRWADLVICRSGAMTIAELTAAGLPAVLVPFPHAVDDHQTANGRQLVDAGAAVMVQESQLTANGLTELVGTWLRDRRVLDTMGRNARALARPAAAAEVARHCLELIDG